MVGGLVDTRELVSRFRQVQDFHANTKDAMHKFRAAYNNENPVVLDGRVDGGDEISPAVVPNLHQQGLDHLARAVAAVLPQVTFPVVGDTDRARKNAAESGKAMTWMWKENKMRRLLRQRARYLPGYGMSAVVLTPDPKLGFPKWEARDPLTTYPAPMTDPTQIVPESCFFTFVRNAEWLQAFYPQAYAAVNKPATPKPADTYTILEYMDEKVRQCVVLGHADEWQEYRNPNGLYVNLLSVEHGLDRPPCTVLRRPTLDKLAGHFDGIMEMHRLQAMLMTLAVIGAKRSVYAEPWLEGDGSQTPKIIQHANALTGDVGIVVGGRLRFERPDANFTTMPMIQQLERNQRVDSGQPLQWGGENPTTARTGRASEVLIDSTIEDAVMEYREGFEDSLEAEISIAVDLCKRWFGDTPRTFYLDNTKKGKGEFTPNKTFDTNKGFVSYAHPAWDSSRMVIEAGQRIGSGLMSHETAMEMDPLIKDVQQERDRMVIEALDAAGFSALQTRAANGEIPEMDLARIKQLVRTGKTWEDAVMQVQEEAQLRQSQENAVAPGDPAAMPGLASPGMGAEAGVDPALAIEQGAIPGPTDDQSELAQLLRGMRTTRNELAVL